MLRSFYYFIVKSEQISLLKGLEPEEIVSQVSIVLDPGLDAEAVLLNDSEDVISDKRSISPALVFVLM